ncbi:hypothetical protein BZA05DRAFT_86625 [Tricharina praecox]|uniref:uncharacterized protein n=1 Tax=Tricharina praecox TaxID=43433 RepID=UPI00221EFB22|nr:uncharacterized protein BZA05DRAFT_86625 [Tricharina praecox]KAI5849236.1 hypothetical protein BZA05DRAFT_86625 [Tricharina praecox]
MSSVELTPFSFAQDNLAPFSFVVLLGLSFTSVMLATLTMCSHADFNAYWRKINAAAICVITQCYVLSMATAIVWFGSDASLQNCETLYMVCAAFWLMGKSMLYMWYSEKVYSHWKSEGLATSRANVFNITANIAILGPYMVALLWVFSSYDVIPTSPTKTCSIGMSFVPATTYLLVYTTVVCLFISMSSVWPYLRRDRLILADVASPYHPTIHPPEQYLQQRKQKKKAIVDAGLNIVTSLVAINVLCAFLICPNGVTWFNIASAAALDLGFATLVTTIATWMERDILPDDASEITQEKVLCDECASYASMESDTLHWYDVL